MKKIISSLILILTLSGCSVGMALSGKESPNLGAIKIGTTRGEVELHLGSPVTSTFNTDNTRLDIYEYEVGNEPSAGRAIGHGVMDVMTFGVWEVIGTPIEGIQGDERELFITYDQNDLVIKLSGSAPKRTF